MTSVRAFIVSEETNTETQLKHKRISAMGNVFSRALSVLTGRKISVRVVNDPGTNAPAWSTTKSMCLNVPHLRNDFTPRGIASLQGVSFHELAHLRYTPRQGSDLVVRIQSHENAELLWHSFNCLEDSRIENFLIAYLPSIKSWITATIYDYLLDQSENLDKALPLIYGRYYLPDEIRQLVLDKYYKQDDVAEIISILDEYTSLIIDSSNTDQAFNLIERFAKIIVSQSQDRLDPFGHDYRPVQGYESSDNRPAPRRVQERDRDKVVKVRVPLQPKPKENTPPSQEGDMPPAQPKNTDKGKGNYPVDDYQESFDDIDNDYYSPNNDYDYDGESNGAGNQEDTTGDNTQVEDLLDELLGDVIQDVYKDITNIAKQLGITDLDGGDTSTPQRAKYNSVTAPTELVTISRAFGRELERLRADYDPEWVRYRDTGKINPFRYVRGDELDTIFDEYIEGRDDVTEIEAVILLDKSGSMEGDNANNAYQSMYAIKKALEQVNARTTVCLFDYNTYLLYSADEKADTTIRDSGAGGGTNPEKALMYAKRVLAETDKPIRILFMITDGQWESHDGEVAVRDMRNAGVLTCQALITGYDSTPKEYVEQSRHSFELMSAIPNARALLGLAKELVRLSIHRNLTK